MTEEQRQGDDLRDRETQQARAQKAASGKSKDDPTCVCGAPKSAHFAGTGGHANGGPCQKFESK